VEVVNEMSKRQRSSGGSRGGYNAGALSASLAKRFPYSEYGRMVHKRGGEMVGRYGATLAEANAEQRAARRAEGWIGRGKYNFGRALLREGVKLGKRYAAPLATAVASRYLGPQAGQMAGQLTRQIVGSGAYSIGDSSHVTNAIIQGSTAKNPGFSSYVDETGDVIINHREYIADMFGPSVPFANTSFALNPALQGTFPWLSQVACNYDEYEFTQLLFEYRSTTTDIGTTTNGQCGTVVMATNYNSAAGPFTDKQQMMEYAHAHSSKTTEHMMHGVECDRSKVALSNVLYTRANPVMVGQDLKTYDHGLFQLAICNSPTGFINNPIGELWVHYTVRLSKPKLWVTRGFSNDRDCFMSPTQNSSQQSTSFQPGIPLPANKITFRGQQNNIGVSLSGYNDGYSPQIPWNGVNHNVNTGLLQLTFPPSYSGNIAIRCYHSVSNLSANTGALHSPFEYNWQNGALLNAGPSFPGVSDFAPGGIAEGIILQGNIQPVYDLYDHSGYPSWAFISRPIAAGATVGDCLGEIHVLVGSALGPTSSSATVGLPNVVSIALNPNSVQCFYYSWYIEVVQYNSQGAQSNTVLMSWIDPRSGTVYGGNQV